MAFDAGPLGLADLAVREVLLQRGLGLFAGGVGAVDKHQEVPFSGSIASSGLPSVNRRLRVDCRRPLPAPRRRVQGLSGAWRDWSLGPSSPTREIAVAAASSLDSFGQRFDKPPYL